MTLSDLAVRRPIFAFVMAAILCMLGLVAFMRLPVRELPRVDPPQVTISTIYQGASAEVIETRITEPIEREVSAIEGIDRVTSSSRDGRSQIVVLFTIDKDMEAAANDVRDRVSRVASQLPPDALSPTILKVNADSDPVVSIDLRGGTLSRLELSDYLDRNIIQRLTTIPGVAQVPKFGAQTYSMRIWLDSTALAGRGLTVDDVARALQRHNVQLPAGSLQGADKDYTINVSRRYVTAADFAKLPVARGHDGYVTRLGDVARVEEAASEVRAFFKGGGRESIGVQFLRQADANDLDISNAVRKTLAEIQATLPKGIEFDIAWDNSAFTREALKEVYVTLGIAIVLVALVNLLFLGSWRAALIPTIVAPICLVSTLAALALFGFSINLLTLLALVLAIGLVVDDAIVVTENIQRRMDAGEPPLLAAETGARQVYFAVIATTATLISVFAPLMFLPGYVGKLFVELAVTVACSIAISAVLALSLTPALASKLLRPAQAQGKASAAVDRCVHAVGASYRRSLGAMMGRRTAVAGVAAVMVAAAAAAAGIYLILPAELAPEEDRSRVDINIAAPEGSGYDYTLARVREIEPILQTYIDEGKASRMLLMTPGPGGGAFNGGTGYLLPGDWRDRPLDSKQLAAELNRSFAAITGARVTASTRAAFQRQGGGGTGNNVQFIALGPEYESTATWMEPILRAASDNPGLTRVTTDYEPNAPRLMVEVDEDRAGALGVSAAQVGDALYAMFGPRRVTTYTRGGREYDVLLQAGQHERRLEDDLKNIYVRSDAGVLVPVSAVVDLEVEGALANRKRVDQMRAVTITAFLNPGYTVPDAMSFFSAEAAKQPPSPVVIRWGGAAKDLLDAGNSTGYAFALALVVVFLVLAAQFESLIYPAVIMLTAPIAAAGGLFGLWMGDASLNLYSQIGLIILVGIAAKNGILIVEFANQLRDEGLSARDAVMEAAQTRLRPIVMTSVATAAGALPLALAAGPGSNSRHAMGVVIISGALFSSLLTLFVIPVVYDLVSRFTKSPDWTSRRLEIERATVEAKAAGAASRAAE